MAWRPVVFASALFLAAITVAYRYDDGQGTTRNMANAAAPDKGCESSDKDDESPGAEINPLGPNAGCYVCHMTFVREPLAKEHLAAKIGCIKCHGVSADHANDEDVGATKPDIFFKRDQVDDSCNKCHKTHDAAAIEVLTRFKERRLPLKPPPVCTDCHGMHKIEKPKEEEGGKTSE